MPADAGKQKNPAASSKPSKPLANSLLDDVTDVRPAVGRTTPVGTDPEPHPTNAPSTPVTHGPERAKRDQPKKK